jgi:hypothetical protein
LEIFDGMLLGRAEQGSSYFLGWGKVVRFDCRSWQLERAVGFLLPGTLTTAARPSAARPRRCRGGRPRAAPAALQQVAGEVRGRHGPSR